jgi:iron complex outermembrane receptor protein
MRHLKSTANPIALAVAAAFFSALPADTLAQTSSVLEEVIVTAQKREQSLQDVGIAVTAFTGDQMRALGVKAAATCAASHDAPLLVRLALLLVKTT